MFPENPTPLLATFAITCCILVSMATNVNSLKYDKQASEDLIQALFDKIASLQNQKDIPFVKMKTWMAQKGVYESDIKLNFYGKMDVAEVRRMMNIKDNNMFVTAWVTSSLLEALRFGQSPRPSEFQLQSALDAIYAHRDHNKHYNTSTYAFWQQQYNETLRYWDSTPQNLLGAFSMLDDVPLTQLEAILKAMGLEDIGKILEQIKRMQGGYTQAFHIPPDFDDTFVNIGLGTLLHGMRQDLPEAWNKWAGNNQNLTSAFVALDKYAYRPFSLDNNTNYIDPRTYFYIRPFLDQAYSTGQRNVALVSTWIQNLEEARVEYYKGVIMPFQCNNVDVTVAANTVYGITSSILAGLVKPDILDGGVGQIYLNTSSMMAFEIANNLTDRADLALLYYPSKIEFNWFVARTVDIMESHLITQSLPHPTMKAVYITLKQAMEGPATEFILSQAKTDVLGTFYFDDFLGNGDLTQDGRPLNRAEDRIFTTAMACNALMYTWTRYDAKTKACTWKQGVPDKVQLTIEGAILWLLQHTLDGNYDPWNAFFSGSVKGFDTLPELYPGNMHEHLNGTPIADTNTPIVKGTPMAETTPLHSSFGSRAPSIYAVRGYIPKSSYDKMLKEKHFNQTTPLIFHGYNAAKGFFPLWSSEPYTYSTTLLAMSRFNNLMDVSGH